MDYNKLLQKIFNLKYFLLVPIILYSIFIIYLSSLSAIPYVISHFEIKDKILHYIGFMGYGLLLFLPIFALNQNFSQQIDKISFLNHLKKSYLYTFIISFIFAVSDEIHQSFVPGRDADFYDLLSDTLGILTSLLIYHLIFKFLIKKIKTN